MDVLADKARLGDLALAQQGGGLRRLALLHNLRHRLHPVGVRQGAQLVQTAGHIVFALVQRQQHHGQLFGGGGLLCGGAKVKLNYIFFAHTSSFNTLQARQATAAPLKRWMVTSWS